MDRGLKAYGKCLGKNPVLVVAASSIVLLVCVLGLIFAEVETDLLDMWVPQKGRIHKEIEFSTANYDQNGFQTFIIKPKDPSDGARILSEEVMSEIEDFSRWFMNFEYTSSFPKQTNVQKKLSLSLFTQSVIGQ